MKFFADTADIAEIKELTASGLLDGVTTNPSLIAKSGKNFVEILGEICSVVKGPVSAEVTATDTDSMLKEADILAKVAENIAIKVPLTWDGLKACRKLADKEIMVNVTLCFSATQALLAAKAGATFVSPFVGRLDDIGQDGINLISDIVDIYQNYQFSTQILVASIRSPIHILRAAKLGAHICTIPPQVIRQLSFHPLTEKGLEAFLADWKESGQKILSPDNHVY